VLWELVARWQAARVGGTLQSPGGSAISLNGGLVVSGTGRQRKSARTRRTLSFHVLFLSPLVRLGIPPVDHVCASQRVIFWSTPSFPARVMAL